MFPFCPDLTLLMIISRYSFNLMTGILDKFTAPNPDVRATTRGDIVCLFCRGEITLWSFGGGRSTTLDLGHLQPDRWRSIDILFHPLRENVVFIYHGPVAPKNGDYHIHVSEYHDGIFVKLHDFPVPEIRKGDANPVADEHIVDQWRVCTDSRRISPYGDYVLLEKLLIARNTQPADGTSSRAIFVRSTQQLACFNVLTGAFTLRTFPFVGDRRMIFGVIYTGSLITTSEILASGNWALWGNRLSTWAYHDIHPRGRHVPWRVVKRLPPACFVAAEEGTGILRREAGTAGDVLTNIVEARSVLDDWLQDHDILRGHDILNRIDPVKDDALKELATIFFRSEAGHLFGNGEWPGWDSACETPTGGLDIEVWTDEEFTVLRLDNHLTIWSFFSDLKTPSV